MTHTQQDFTPASKTLPKIAPSILTADFGHLAAQIEEAEAAGAELFHLDVMDGNFVPNISFGPSIVAAVRRATELPLHIHLMIDEPEQYVTMFADAGSDLIIVHYEATKHPYRAVQKVKETGKKVGLALNPGTPLVVLEPFLAELALVLVLSVNPGFGGQSYIPGTTERLKTLKEMRDAVNPGCVLEVDGGVKADNIAVVGAAGADIVVVGSAIYNGRSIKDNFAALRGES